MEIRSPSAEVEQHVVTVLGHRLEDPYQWLRDRDDPRVLEYLRAENAYMEGRTAHLQPLRERLYSEFVGRVQEDDTTFPRPDGEYEYFESTEEGKQYWIGCRRRREAGSLEEVLLDVNEMASGHAFLSLGIYQHSPDHRLLAFATDTTGYRRFTLYLKDLASGQLLPDRLEDVSPGAVWSAGSDHLFYLRHDSTLRSHQVWRHQVSSDPAADVLVYEELDEVFNVWISTSASKRVMFINSVSPTTSEVRILSTREPLADPTLVEPRHTGTRYFASDQGDRLILMVDDTGPNYRLVDAPLGTPGREAWRELLPHREDVTLEAAATLRGHIVVTERVDGLNRLTVLPSSGLPHTLTFDEPIHSVSIGYHQFESSQIRYSYESMTTPASQYEYDLDTRNRVLLKRQEIPSGHDPERYLSERLWAVASDGVRVPISLLRRADAAHDPAPLLLYGYGAYGASIDPDFNSSLISLVDRGVTFAIAHVRGGGELGEPWRLAGKLLCKKNTFTDFIACAEHLVDSGLTRPDRLVIQGASAGGLLMGAVLNLRPDLFCACVAQVPFVDALNTMLDPSIPLTAPEYEEWGNPNEPQYFDYIRSYSPYDNVAPREYPAILAVAGFNDSQVHYWEPAKWVAKLRALKLGDRELLLKTYLETGHGGPSGRYEALAERAFVYAWILAQLGIVA